MKLYISRRKAAQLLGVGRGATLEQMIADGRIRQIELHKGRGGTRIVAADVYGIADSADLPKKIRIPKKMMVGNLSEAISNLDF